MSETITSENLQKIFTFPLKDPNWKSKFTIGSLLYLIGFFILPAFIIGGYSYEIMRRMIVEKAEPSMPEWDDYGEYLMNGVKLFGVGLIYGSPTLMLMLPFFLVVFSFPFVAMVSEEYLNAFIVIMPLTIGLLFIASIIGFIFGMLGLAAKGHMVATGDFAAAFRVREWWPIFRANLGGFFLAYLVLMALSYVLTFAVQILMATLVLCIIVPFLLVAVSFYLALVSNVLFARAYADGVEKLAAQN